LDSWAIIRWLEGGEPATAKVEEAMAGQAVMSWINVGEVHYVVQRRAGEKVAGQVVRELRRRVTLDLATEERVIAAASIKAVHRLAYADAFALATAEAFGAELLTGDPEIIDGDPRWNVVDIR
jgi:predicted nucleic acid-binding protein